MIAPSTYAESGRVGESSSSKFKIEAGGCDAAGRIEKLTNTLKSVEQFLPAKEIRDFNPNKVTPRFDIKHLGETNLSHLYDTMASTFWCSQRVQGHYASTKDALYNGIQRPQLKGTLDDAINATNSLGRLIICQSPAIMDRNLVLMWNKIEELPELHSAESIREWMNDNPEELKKVKEVNLTGSDIEVIPPEILAFENLEKVVLYGSKLGAFPHVLEAHPSFNMENLYVDGDFTFFDGLSIRVIAPDDSAEEKVNVNPSVCSMQKMR